MTTEHKIELRLVAELLLKHLGIHKGRYEIAIGFRIGVGPVLGPPDTQPVPGATVGIEGFSLVPVPDHAEGPNIVDASLVNPKLKSRTKAAASPKKAA